MLTGPFFQRMASMPMAIMETMLSRAIINGYVASVGSVSRPIEGSCSSVRFPKYG